ncbi:MAG TPA: hypothetical protein VF698_14515 [Thermoanaerobaculia bacterium]|jgi:hypothetical protein
MSNPWLDEAEATRFHEATQQLFRELETVVDERTFVAYLGKLIEDHDRFPAFWENASTRDYLASARWWGAGSFAEDPSDEPKLRKVATMLTAARYGRERE